MEINVQTCTYHYQANWITVAKVHLRKSGKGKLRKYGDRRRYFHVKVCNSNRKITKQASAPLTMAC